jgi:multidrug efflux pump
MSLSGVSIRRPVLSIVLNIILVLFGIVAFSNLEVREYPSVDPPTISVSANYPGANADVMENQITEPLEKSINGIDGIKSLTSSSSDGSSRINIEFELSRNLEDAANDVRDRVSGAQRNLPPDMDPPVVRKSSADDAPVIFIFIQSSTRNIMDVSDFASNVILERLQTITGVSAVNVQGEKRYAMRIWLDPQKLASYKVTPVEIQNVLGKENVEIPSGNIEGDQTTLSIRTLGRLANPSEFERIIIRQDKNSTVKLSDLGYVIIDAENLNSGLKKGGIPGVGVSINALPGANILDISDQFKKKFEQLKKDVPPDINLQLSFDAAEYVRAAVKEVEETIAIAFFLVFLIIFLFLRDWRSTIIPMIAIPVSIVAAFFVLYAMGFSINVLTLVGVILAIGLVVDDAIVVLENIYSKIEEGMEPHEAAVKGSNEIYIAVISTTLALAAVFMPLFFLQGLVGRLFREFGVMIAASVLISAYVALTLTPMLCSRLLRKHTGANKFYNKTEPFFRGLTNLYSKLLHGFMKVRWVAFVVIIICGLLIYFLGSKLQSELAPLEDRSNMRVSLTAPEGASYEYTLKYADMMNKLLTDSIPESPGGPIEIVGGGFGTTGTNTANINIFLVKPEERQRTQQQLYQMISRNLAAITGVRAFPSQPPTIGSRGSGQPVSYVLQAPSFEKLVEVLPKFMEEANKSNILQFPDVNLKVNKPELTLSINREKANTMGVSTSDIARTLQAAFGGQRFGYFVRSGKQYQVIGQLEREKRNDPYDLRYVYVKNSKGELIQLDNLVTMDEGITTAARNRYNRFISATVSAGLAPGYTIGDGINEMDRISKQVLNPEFTTALAGQSKDYVESSSSLVFVFIFALIIVFLVLAAQFESFVDPFIILMTVPLALTGAVISLFIFSQTLNIFSQIGIIMLIGLVTKNAILIVEFSNQRKETGLKKMQAVIEGAEARFRPILMTSLATVLGALPIALGAGAKSRMSLGIAVVGGLIFATFLTLFIVPAVYSFFSKEYKTAESGEQLALDDNDLQVIPD